jgi:hypothetical protein
MERPVECQRTCPPQDPRPWSVLVHHNGDKAFLQQILARLIHQAPFRRPPPNPTPWDAALDGYVREHSGAAVLGARITVRNVDTNISSDTVSLGDGYYRAPILKVGTYNVSVAATGFKEYTQNGVTLTVGQKGRPDFNMEVGAVSESTEVTAEAPMAESGAAAVGSVLSRKDVEHIPVVSRNIYDFHLPSPGVQGLSSATFGITQFTFGGNERSSWNLDGLDNTQRGANRQIRMAITTPEAVEKMQVLANRYSAEFGRAAGGRVNVILKSGTNSFHGSGLFLCRVKDLQARLSLAAVNPDRTWRDEAVTLGRPIKKDRVFFFTQFENNPYTLPNAITITAAASEGPCNSQFFRVREPSRLSRCIRSPVCRAVLRRHLATRVSQTPSLAAKE